jgi:glycine/serine hydroxymethyltransferase
MTVGQPLNYIRRGTILADDAEDKAGTGLTTGYDQHVTNARPHHGARSDSAVVVAMVASVGRVLKSMTGAAGGVTG